MSCAKYKKLIDEFVSGTLPERAAGELRTHLASCPECTAAHAELASVANLVRTLDREGTSPEFMAGLKAKLRLAESLQARPVARTSIWERLLPAQVARPLAVATVALLLAVVAIGPRPALDTVDIAQTGFAQFCTSQHVEYTTEPPIENQATEWLDSAWSDGDVDDDDDSGKEAGG